MLLAKGCHHFASLTPVKKTSSEAFGIHLSSSSLCLIRDVAVMLTQTGFGDEYLADSRGSKFKGNIRTKQRSVFC
jgi:hypothetical protein